MTVLLFVAVFAAIGVLLYLPFFIWFRRRPPQAGGPLSARVSCTPAGWLLLAAQLAAMFAGIALRGSGDGSPFSRLFEGDLGLLKGWICIVVAFSALGSLLRGAGIVLQRPPAASQAAPGPDGAFVPAAPAQPRRWKVATLRGIPIFVQRSYLYGGLFIALIAQAGPAGIAGYCIAYAALFGLHEAGHVVAARAVGLPVHGVDLSAIGGVCVMQVPRRVRDAWIVYSAGLLVQAALLVATWAVATLSGPAQSPFGIAVAATFTWVNALIFLLNLVPGRTSLGIPTDGAVLWGLALHRFRGAAHPLEAQLAASPLFDPATSLLDNADLRPAGFRHGIEVFNDDTTPMEFVVDMLHRHAGLDIPAATDAMLTIHQRGGMLLPLPDRAAADAVAAAISGDARAQGRRLVCRAVSTSE